MSGHTPGPWGVNLDDHILPRVIRLDGSGDIARVKLSDDDMRESVTSVPLSAFDEADANARLIAASPTMYGFIQEKAEEGDARAVEILEDIHAES